MAYSNAVTDKLYGLLPAHIREADAGEGEPLRALLRIVEGGADAVEGDIRQLGEDAFIETCEPWVAPYIGDLVGNIPLFDGARGSDGDTAAELFRDLVGPAFRPPTALRARADIAKTIYYRRRKGTLPMLEELARDVTGWSAHAVEFFELLGWTQWVRNHLRMGNHRTPDLRSVERMDRLNRAFDGIAHTIDVRPISQFEGWHNIRNIGFFLWRLGAYRLEATQARRLGAAGDFRYHWGVLGQDAPLFSRARREGDEAGLATELHVPQAIRPARFFADLQAYSAGPLPKPDFTDFYGLFDAVPGFEVAPAPSLAIVVDGTPIPAGDVRCANLSVWRAAAASRVLIDVALGRLALGPDRAGAADVRVYHHYGFPAELGGGPYRRRAWLVRRDLVEKVYPVNASGAAGSLANIADALAQWVADGGPEAIVSVGDNRTYTQALAIDVGPASGGLLAIEAADGFRPHLRLERPLRITGVRDDFALTLGGLLIEGQVEIAGSLRRLRLLHSTLVPGVSIAAPDPDLPPTPPVPTRSSIVAADALPTGAPANTELAVELAFSITGPLRIPTHAQGIVALDSIVDGAGEPAMLGVDAADAPAPPLRLERSTLRGAVHTTAILFASETIFDGVVTADRVQVGCVRFCYVAPGSHTPRRYRCEPDRAERIALDLAELKSGPLTPAERDAIRERVRRRVRPEYTDEPYGLPAYLQLAIGGPPEIATGAEDGSETGAYGHLKQPQRAANLRTRLEEYLPFGLDPGLIYVT